MSVVALELDQTVWNARVALRSAEHNRRFFKSVPSHLGKFDLISGLRARPRSQHIQVGIQKGKYSHAGEIDGGLDGMQGSPSLGKVAGKY